MKKLTAFILLALIMVSGFSSSAIVAAQKLNIKITADVFELDGEKKQVVASGNVLMIQDDLKVHGDMAKYDQDVKKIEVTGHVQAVKGDIALTCNRITAFPQEERIFAEGGVKFSFAGIRGESNTANIQLKNQKVVLTGNPKAWRGTDQISGSTITIYLDKKKIVTEGQTQVLLSVDRFK